MEHFVGVGGEIYELNWLFSKVKMKLSSIVAIKALSGISDPQVHRVSEVLIKFN